MLNSSTLTFLQDARPIRFANIRCAYCGIAFGKDVKRTKDHVIGRKFVPAGRMNDEWNLILGACEACNRAKSQLEDDISAITMQPNILGQHAVDDDLLREDARRKGQGSTSRKTQRLVAKSQEEISISGHIMPGLHATFNMKAPPQLDRERAFQLACYQFQGFFYWITYNSETRLSNFLGGTLAPVGIAQRLDWGNVQLRRFQKKMEPWDYRVNVAVADAFFKIVIRRAPSSEEKPLWGWALEWNHNYRVIGFAGHDDVIRDAFETLPALSETVVAVGKNQHVTSRIEVPLPEDEDRLFVFPSEEAPPKNP